MTGKEGQARKRGKVSFEEAERLIGSVDMAQRKGIRQRTETHNLRYVFWLGFLLGDSKSGGKHERLRAVLKQERFWD